MTQQEIKVRLEKALDSLYVKDWYLLKNKVHERSITHKLAEYLQHLFPEYEVDCEYDFDIENPNGHFKKQFSQIVSTEIKNNYSNNINKINEVTTDNDILSFIQTLQKNFFPDIIIHKRGTNTQNLLIIEAKKDNNLNNSSFDVDKLKAYTKQDDSGNKYFLGAQVIFSVGVKYRRGSTIISYYSDGQQE